MNKFFTGIKLILTNAKKYGFTFLVVLILMGVSTYLNVQAPKLLGDSFNALGEYVALGSANDHLNKVKEIINDNSDITSENKQEIVSLLSLSDEDTKKLDQMTTEELKMQLTMQETISNAILLDKDYVINNKAFNQQQVDYIQNSDIDIATKMALLHMPPQQLEQIAQNTVNMNNLVNEKHDKFIEFVVKLLLTFVFLGIGMLTYTLLFVNVTVGITKNIRNKLFDKISNLSIRFYDKSNTGDLLSRFTNDIENITMFLNSAFIQSLSAIFMLVGLCIMMWNEDTSHIIINGFTVQKPLFWTILIFGIIAIVASSGILKNAQKYVSKQQQKLGQLNGYVDEILSGQKEIISNNLQLEAIKKFEEYNQDFKDNAFKGQIYSGLLMPIMMGIGFIALGFIVFIGSDLVIQTIFSVGLLIAFIQYSQSFFQNFSSAVSEYNMIELGMSGANRVQEIFDEQEEVVNQDNPLILQNPNSPIIFKNVNFEYDKNKPILKDINFTVQPGQMVALVGPTGSGKTTIMNLLNRFYDVTSGEIIIDGHNIKEYDIDNLRRNIGLVLQDSILFKGTVRENVRFGKPDATDEEVVNACKISNIHDYIMTLEHGYDTEISDSSSTFSTGQKQLLSIARTIITNPSILVLDEATSNVDTITESKIQKAMDNVISGRTSFVIAHRLKTILKADKILVINDGHIIESGNHKELMKLNGFYAELYNNQFVE